MQSVLVPQGCTPTRLDVFLTRHIAGCSRRTAQRAIANGEVRINHRRARKGDQVIAGDFVEIGDACYAERHLQPNPRLLVPVLFMDTVLIAVDKPAGMPSHAVRLTDTDTVANCLLARFPELSRVGRDPREPGLVHRLDTDTSGVLLAARSARAYTALREQFSTQRVHKQYAALVAGDVPDAGELRTPIAHDRRNRRRMQVCGTERTDARPALTRYQPIERFGGATLLQVEIATGVMHQIRVHLASIGHPVLGDRLYGVPNPDAPARQLLHASRITVVHPDSGAPLSISSALAPDFQLALEALRTRKRDGGVRRPADGHQRR